MPQPNADSENNRERGSSVSTTSIPPHEVVAADLLLSLDTCSATWWKADVGFPKRTTLKVWRSRSCLLARWLLNWRCISDGFAGVLRERRWSASHSFFPPSSWCWFWPVSTYT